MSCRSGICETAAGPGKRPGRGPANPFSPKSIRGKMIVSLLAIYLLGSMAAVTALYSISRLEGKLEIIDVFYDLNQLILETRRYEKNFLLYRGNSDLEDALKYLQKVQDGLEHVNAMTAMARISLGQVSPPQDVKISVYGDLLRQLGRPTLTQEQRSNIEVDVRRRGHALTQFVLEIDSRARRELEAAARDYRNLALTILASALIIGAILSLVLGQWISAPIQTIRRAAARIMKGELTTIPLDEVNEQSVECAELVDSLNMMLHALAVKQDQLVQSTKMAAIGKVTAGIAHEINNPLNNISLTAEVLLQELPGQDADKGEQREMIDDILGEADRARAVVRHLLDFSRARESTIRERVDLVALLSKSVALLANQIRIDQTEIRMDLSAEPVVVLGNPNQLQQVFVNIILNAAQAMKPAGGFVDIKIQAEKDGGQASMEFTDTGPGMSEEVQARIFDPFFTTKTEGTGLGLSVSHAIIKEHGGDIRLKSQPGSGSTFIVTIPLCPSES